MMGKRSKNNENQSEVGDRISNLSDDLIFRIFSKMSTEHVIPTGVLSKRWKNLWKQMPNMRFDKKHHSHRFNMNVVSALVSRGNSPLDGLKISIEDRCEKTDLVIWTSIAKGRNVSKLVLILKNVVDPPVFPACSLADANRLKILKLVGNLRFNIPEPCVSLKSLKELHLHHARFQDDASLSHLLAGFPSLEILIVELYIDSGVDIFSITMKSLKRLTLGSHNCEVENFEIEAPLLKYLNFRRLDGVYSCKIGRIEEIEEVKLMEHDEDMDEEILRSINSVKVLSLCPPVKYPVGKLFFRLTSLELYTYGRSWCQLLSCFLDSSPNLQVLKLIGGTFTPISRTWVEPVCVSNCLLHSLNTLEWSKHIWDGEDEIDVATYVLTYAEHLKNATFITFDVGNANSDLLRKSTLTLSELRRVPRASTACNIRFINMPSTEYIQTKNEDSDLEDFFE